MDLYITFSSVDILTSVPTQEHKDIFPFICVFFNFFHHCGKIINVQLFHVFGCFFQSILFFLLLLRLVKCVPNCLILPVAIVNRIFLISFTVYLLLVYTLQLNFVCDFVS